jgi:hypothetical protein
MDDLLKSPFQTGLSMLLNLIPDLVLILVSNWYELLTPDSVNFSLATNLLGLTLALIGGTLAYFYFRQSKDASDDSTLRWKWQALILGVSAVLLGILPAYAAGYVIHTKLFPWNARFAIGSLFGAGLLVTLVIETVVSSAQARRVVLALLIGLTIGWQVRYTNVFRHAWEAETDFYNQLTLRAPSIPPHTAFLAKEEFLGMMGDYPTSFALNSIYTQPLGAQGREARTWLFLVDTNFAGRVDELVGKAPLSDEKHSTEFTGKNDDSLVIMYEPELYQCLWVIKPEDASVQIIPETLRTLSPLSNTNLIDPSAAPTPFLQTILPSMPATWCTYYQRGSLAVQLKEWKKAVTLWENAGKKNLRPANGYEYLPFIEAYGMTGNWPKAFEITRTANKVSKSMENSLCGVWARLQVQTTPSSEREAAVLKGKDYLGCK